MSAAGMGVGGRKRGGCGQAGAWARLAGVLAVAGAVLAAACATQPGSGADAEPKIPRTCADTHEAWLLLAEQGDARAQDKVGQLYEFGTGRPRDDRQAVLWYRKSADQGFAP